jgi:hypothetical protein
MKKVIRDETPDMQFTPLHAEIHETLKRAIHLGDVRPTQSHQQDCCPRILTEDSKRDTVRGFLSLRYREIDRFEPWAEIQGSARSQERAQLFALSGHRLILEDGPALLNGEAEEDDTGDDISYGLSTQAE